MSVLRLFFRTLTAALVLIILSSPLSAGPCMWWAPTGGSWNNADNWDCDPAIPNNTASTNYNAYINTAGLTVSLDSSVKIGNYTDFSNTQYALAVGSGVTLNINGATLTDVGPSGTYGRILNLGQINLGANGALNFENSTPLTFVISNSQSTSANVKGTITLGSDSAKIMGSGLTSGTHRLNIEKQIINGYGQLGANSLQISLSYNGLVSADSSGHTLVIDPSSGGFLNEGTMQAGAASGPAATLRLYDGTFTNYLGGRGTIQANANGIVLVDNATVNGGSVTINNGGQLQLVNGTLNGGGTPRFADYLVLTNNGTITSVSGANLIQNTGTDRGIDFRNGGLLEVTGGSSLTLRDTTSSGSATWANSSKTGVGGTMRVTNGTLTIETGRRTFDNTSGMIEARGGTVVVNGSTISNGAFHVFDGGTLDFTKNGTRNVTISGSNITIDAGGRLRNLSGANVVNGTGTLLVNGTLDIASGSSLTVGRVITIGSTGRAQVSGILADVEGIGVDGGVLNGSGEVRGPVTATNGGKVAGNLDIIGKLTIGERGVLEICNSAGHIDVTGDFDMTAPSSVWNLGIASATSFDQLDVTGRAYLGGTLNIIFEDGYVPLAGSHFTFLTALNGITGKFAVVNFGDPRFRLVYSANDIVLTNDPAVPEPAAFVLMGTGLLLIPVIRRRRRG